MHSYRQTIKRTSAVCEGILNFLNRKGTKTQLTASVDTHNVQINGEAYKFTLLGFQYKIRIKNAHNLNGCERFLCIKKGRSEFAFLGSYCRAFIRSKIERYANLRNGIRIFLLAVAALTIFHTNAVAGFITPVG